MAVRTLGDRSLWRGDSVTDAETKRADRMRDILDQLFAEVVENHAAAMAQVIVHASRNADFATLDQALEPSGYVHAVAEDVIVLDHDVADIEANPEAHPATFRLAFVSL